MKKLLLNRITGPSKILLLFVLLFAQPAFANVNLNFDIYYTANSLTTETSTGVKSASDSSEMYFILDFLFVELDKVKFGGAYYKQNTDAATNESILGLSVHYGDSFFVELKAGQYTITSDTGADVNGVGVIFTPGKIFDLGGNWKLRVSMPFIHRSYEDTTNSKITKLTYSPFVGVSVDF
ncbi:MAG: hypothetical protein HOO06_03695 [Bdellovibrionaceae bacterium]|mgnify:CR=1 FL=1|jgi:hypothetical protein|nr:hypothetical protein [Pseudobdellovibrionaceae bacterium]